MQRPDRVSIYVSEMFSINKQGILMFEIRFLESHRISHTELACLSLKKKQHQNENKRHFTPEWQQVLEKVFL